MRALERALVGREDDPRREAAPGLVLVAIELPAQEVDVGDLEVVLRELVLVLPAHLPVVHTVRHPADVVDRLLQAEEHRDALEAVGELAGDRGELDASGLLEVGELRDLHAVEHHLPADAPRAQGRCLPVVLLEAQVVDREIDSHRFEALDVELLDVERRRLQDDLELVVLVEPERVVAVAPVRRPARRLDVGDPPGLRPQHPQEGVRVHRPGTDFEIVGLLQDTALPRPVVRKRKYQLLKALHPLFFLSSVP